jgi:molybdopterin converting factor small subunit
MPLVRFTANIQRHVACPPRQVGGSTVREALDDYFADAPEARGYVLDDQHRLRRHMAIFVDGRPMSDRDRLSDSITNETTIDVFQALSGG